MSAYYVVPLARLIEQFERLPGTGHKSAQRLAYYVLGLSKEEAKQLTGTIREAYEKIHYRKEYCNLTDQELCPVRRSADCGRSIICVTEGPRDVFAFERTNEYKGLYYILHGAIPPLNDVGPDQPCIKELLACMNDEIKEIIITTNPTVEGEVTAMYLPRLPRPMGITVTRLVYGIPVGGDLEYADRVTSTRMMEGRRETQNGGFLVWPKSLQPK